MHLTFGITPRMGRRRNMIGRKIIPPLLSEKENKYIQNVTGKFLFNGRDVDPRMLTTLIAIASQKSVPTADTMKQVNQLLVCCASQEDAIVTFRKKSMNLAGHSDAGYLNKHSG